MRCDTCFRHCDIPEGGRGFCGARTVRDGRVVPENYGRITSMALDPIEKKPLARFFPGSYILSVGSYGCNLRCPFCQNDSISYGPDARYAAEEAVTLSPEQLADKARALADERPGNLGLAFTYNEPLIGWEFVRDTARLTHEQSLKNVLVTNGTAERSVLRELLPYIHAMNVDLKCFTDEGYTKVLGGDRAMTMAFIEEAFSYGCHVEVTTLIVPGLNDTEEEILAIAEWLAGLDHGRGRDIPLHLSRFFPRFRMTDRPATDVAMIYRFADLAGRVLNHVYTGIC